jgi:type IV fimbrial biogenesis protein FimT
MSASVKQRGVTLVELVVTLALITLLLTLGVPSLSWMVGRSAVATTTNELRGALAYARGAAVAGMSNVTICPGTKTGCDPLKDWGGGWVAFSDTDQDGRVTGADKPLRVWSARGAGIQVLATAHRVEFDENGIAWRTDHWRVCREGMEPRGIVLLATGTTMMSTPNGCVLPE